MRVSSAAEPPGITETDKFLFTYLGHRSPVIPLGHLFRPHPADTSRLLTMMALGKKTGDEEIAGRSYFRLFDLNDDGHIGKHLYCE